MQYLHLDSIYLEKMMGSKNFTQQMLMFSAITGGLDKVYFLIQSNLHWFLNICTGDQHRQSSVGMPTPQGGRKSTLLNRQVVKRELECMDEFKLQELWNCRNSRQ